MTLENWHGVGTLVTDSTGSRALWIEPAGELADALGPVTAGGEHEWIEQLDDLVLVVGEWIVCTAERDGPVAYSHIHPALRARLFQLLPSVVLVSDEDETSYVLS